MTTDTLPTTLKITTRCRALGLGSSITPGEAITAPSVVGDLDLVEAEYDRVRDVHAYEPFRMQLFLRGRPVTHPESIGWALYELRRYGQTEVRLAR